MTCLNCQKKYKVTCPFCKTLLCKNCITEILSQHHLETKCPKCQTLYDQKTVETFYNEKNITKKLYQIYKQSNSNPKLSNLKPEIPNPETPKTPITKTLIDVPMDGSCFYHCIVKALSSRDFTDPSYQDICEILKPIVENYIQTHEEQEQETQDHEEENQQQGDDKDIFRYSIAQIATEEDYQNYKILQQAEEGNIPLNSLEELKKTLAYSNEYANHISIQLIFRLFQGLLGIYIYKNNTLVSPREWHEKKYNLVLELLENQHYNLVQYEGYPILLKSEEIQTIHQLQVLE
jgi:hypothetical protein